MLVPALVKNMNIRVIGGITTPISMASHISSFPFHLPTLLLSLLIFAIRSHPLSSMLGKGMRTSSPFSFLCGVEHHFALMYGHLLHLLCFLCNICLVHIEHFSAVKSRSIGREGYIYFHLAAQSLYGHCPTRKIYGLYRATVLVYRAMVEQQMTSSKKHSIIAHQTDKIRRCRGSPL